MAEAPVLSGRLLGRLRVSLAGRPVDTGRRRTRDLLAYLLLHRAAPLWADQLVEEFWPSKEPAAARNNLHVGLAGVRRALAAACAAPVLERRHGAYLLAGAAVVWVDVEDFERACRRGREAERVGDAAAAAREYELAAQLYEGDLLAEDPYAEWAMPARETLRLEAVAAQRRLLALYLGAGDDGAAMLLGRRILDLDPYDEEAHRGLMRCYLARGQRHLALAQYQRCAEDLWRAFRILPDRATTELHRQARGDPPPWTARLAGPTVNHGRLPPAPLPGGQRGPGLRVR